MRLEIEALEHRVLFIFAGLAPPPEEPLSKFTPDE